MRLATLLGMTYWRSARVHTERSHLVVVARTGASVPSRRARGGSALVRMATTHRRAGSVVRLVPGPATRAARGLDAEWWRIAAGIGRALAEPGDSGYPPACA